MNIPSELEHKLKPIVEVYLPKRKYEIALEELNKLTEDYLEYDILCYYLGICHANLMDYDNAVRFLEKIKDSTEISVVQVIQANMLLGFVYTQSNRLELAENSFHKALAINPQSSMSHSALGYVYYLTKRFPEAIRNFRLAIELDPNNAGAHNNLGYTLAELGLNINEAVKECRKAVALNRHSAAYRDSLGWSYFIAGKYTEAVNELKKALEFAPNHPLISEHLKQALQKRDKYKRKRK